MFSVDFYMFLKLFNFISPKVYISPPTNKQSIDAAVTDELNVDYFLENRAKAQ